MILKYLICLLFLEAPITFGDPHIQTFDGFTYSFNGLGEYVYLNVYNKTTNAKLIEIQARTRLATNVNGTTVNATIFSAFAMKEFENDTTAQVEMSDSKDGLIIRNGVMDLTKSFQQDPEFKSLGVIGIFRRSNETQDPEISFTFKTEISLTVSVSAQMLSVGLSIPDNIKGTITTSGLQGIIDGDPNNDLSTPDGTILSPNSTDEEIFHNFGQLWLINQSLFIYPAGQTKEDYIDRDFRPIFLNKTGSKYAEAKKVCGGEANVACIYDFMATDNLVLAEKTKSIANKSREILKQTKNNAPVINATSELQINVNQSIIWEVKVIDDDNDTVEIRIEDGDEYVNITGNGNIFNITILIKQLAPLNISIIAVDSKNKSSGEFPLTILLCSGCSGNGYCDKSDIEMATSFYEELSCTCDIGYDGDNCEEDIDGCANDPCISKDYCQDISAEEVQRTGREFNCSCPDGYTLQDNRCKDINECDIITGNKTKKCDQFCINNDGGYTCACEPEYELKEGRFCANLDECGIGLDNCEQLCNDTTPGYTCSCNTGYMLKPDNTTCEKDNTTSQLSCTRNCTNAIGCEGNTCICKKGFERNGTGSCVDIDECKKDPCEGTCTNTDGSYNCECPFGQKTVGKIKCEVCDDKHWGTNCSTLCDCSGENTEECNPKKGCVCQGGWRGQFCTEDIDECQEENRCTRIQTCKNTNGSYDCVCLDGYDKINDGCVNIDECSTSADDCPDKCIDFDGGYRCECSIGTRGVNGKNCKDINECEENLHGCEQDCKNNNGSFTCDCFKGYKLMDDRTSCEKISEIQACRDANCSKEQFCKFEDNKAECFCKLYYKYNNVTKVCDKIDLCLNNPCQNGTCVPNTNVITCQCDKGYFQEYDTCKSCKSPSFGQNCSQTCNCIHGTCNNIQGCVCNPGYRGLNCDIKINHCLNNPCDETSTCQSGITTYTCKCKSGYKNATSINGTCTQCDAEHWGDGCLTKCNCVHGTCNNTKGCICDDKKYSGTFCENEIDYCANKSCNEETSVCKSGKGKYTCECRRGYKKSDNGTCTGDLYLALGLSIGIPVLVILIILIITC